MFAGLTHEEEPPFSPSAEAPQAAAAHWEDLPANLFYETVTQLPSCKILDRCKTVVDLKQNK